MSSQNRSTSLVDRWRAIPRPLRRGGVVVLVLAVAVAALAPQADDANEALDAAGGMAWWLVVTASLLQLLSILCQAMLLRAVVPRARRPGRPLATRVEFASMFASHTIPGGTVAGTALGFQLLRRTGVPGPEAGFAVAVRGFGSALVLNVLLWAALVVSIPLHGFDPRYTLVALLGVGLLTFVAAQLMALLRGRERTARWLGNLLTRFPGVERAQVSDTVDQLADRARTLLTDQVLLRTVVSWSAAYWLLAAGSLWVFLQAVGDAVPADELLVAFGVANVAAFLPLTPRGLGLVEVTLVSMLTGFGVPSGEALVGVLAWRLVSFWAPIPVGGLSYLSLNVGPHRLPLTTEHDETEHDETEHETDHDEIGGDSCGPRPDAEKPAARKPTGPDRSGT